MQDINSYDANLYLGLCLLNIVLLSISCWLVFISPFWIVGCLVLTIGAVVDVIMVRLHNDYITTGWHWFMAFAAGVCSILGMGIWTAVYCALEGVDRYCSCMIAATIIGIVVSIIEVFIILVGKRAGYRQGCCCCCSPPTEQTVVYPVIATYPNVQLTTSSYQVPVMTTTMQVPMSTVTVVPLQQLSPMQTNSHSPLVLMEKGRPLPSYESAKQTP